MRFMRRRGGLDYTRILGDELDQANLSLIGEKREIRTSQGTN